MTASNPGLAPDAFLPFPEDSMARRVHREGIILLGGGCALLMQIAHPSVAQGVAEHSRYRDQRWQRLLRTLRPTLAIVFGTRQQAIGATAGINRLHDSVTGAGYAAKDPALLLWVLAPLIDTSLQMYERFISPLNPAEKHAYYEDMKRVGTLLDIPERTMPETLEALQAYGTDMSESLVVTEQARQIAGHLFDANPATWTVMRTIEALTAGLLPAPLRDQYGLRWGPRREKALGALVHTSRLLMPRLPRRLRAPPWFLMPEQR